jgi:hypothetical protein
MFLRNLFSRPKEGIRINKVYDGVAMKPVIIAADKDTTRDRVEDIKANPKRYAWDTKNDDHLSHIPELSIVDVNPPEFVEEHNVHIVCDINIVHTTHLPDVVYIPPFPKLLIVLFVFSVLGLVGLSIWFTNAAEIAQIDAACYYYTKNGTPQSLIIEGEEYKLNPDGSFDAIDKVFLNPYIEEQLHNMVDSDCIVINTK